MAFDLEEVSELSSCSRQEGCWEAGVFEEEQEADAEKAGDQCEVQVSLL